MLDNLSPQCLPIYLDHAATTPLCQEALERMAPFFSEQFENPASHYLGGKRSNAAVGECREALADYLNCNPDEVYFTSGGTESDNWAIQGAYRANSSKRNRILVSAIEHHAVLDSALAMRKYGADVELIPVDGNGVIVLDRLRSMLDERTCLVSVMHVNNEVGTIQPVKEISRMCSEYGALFHMDAVQSFGKISVDLRDLNCSLLTVSSHKIYGPKGIGALYIKHGVEIEPLHFGGEQESGKRGGTLNVPGIVGFHGALERLDTESDIDNTRNTQLSDLLVSQILQMCPDALLSGGSSARIPNIVHFCFPNVHGETVLIELDEKGICASAASACSTKSTEPSHVLIAMGIAPELAMGAVRFSLGRTNTQEQILYSCEILSIILKELQGLSRTIHM